MNETAHVKSGILPPPELSQAFLGAEFFFQYIFHDPELGEANINHYLDMSPEDITILNKHMHEEAAPHEDAIERHVHISDYWALIGQYFGELASKDGLTGLFNKRAFTSEIDSALKRMAVKQAVPFERRKLPSAVGTVALIDIDLNRFKPINDVFSHATGDLVIQKTAEILQEQTRNQDYAGRLGGDEFSMLLVNVSPTQAPNILTRIEDAFKELIIEKPLNLAITMSDKDCEKIGREQQELWTADDLTVAEYRTLGLEVEKTTDTIRLIVGASFGMAMAEPEMSVSDLQEQSDKNMYQSKNKSQIGWNYARS